MQPLQTLRPRARSERGFTLVEMLVVVMVVGILAAIALPLLDAQRNKGHDANAKALARTGANGLEAHRVQRGAYDATRAEILEIAPELSQAPSWTLTAEPDRYVLRVVSGSGNWFEISREQDGALKRLCETAGEGGCGDDATW